MLNQLGLNFSLLFDPLSIFFIAVILLISIPSSIYSIAYLKEHSFQNKIINWVLLIIFICSMIFVVTVRNALAFLIVWEIMSLVSYFLVIADSEKAQSIKAGMIYIVMTHIGTAFITAGLLIMFKYTNSFDFITLKQMCHVIPSPVKNIIFLCLLIGFGTKAGIVPLHVWLPYAHPQAPSHVSSIMSGVMIKTAIYGIIRFIVFILGVNAVWWGSLILILASVSCLVGIMYALMEHDIKRLLAYSSVENIGIILLGVGASVIFHQMNMPVLSVISMTAGLYHLINHAIFKSLLFLCAGSIYKSTGLRNMEKLGGLIKTMPYTAVAFLIGSMAISALPPFNGFVSEWLTLQTLFLGVLNSQVISIKIIMSLCAAILALTGGLAAACFVKTFGITFLAMPRSKEASEAKEVHISMIVIMIFMSVLAVVFGLFASTIIKFISIVPKYVFETNIDITNFALNNVNFSSPLIAVILISIALIAFYVISNKRKISVNKTWGCGYYNITPKNEYTATAFSKPFRIAYEFFYQPYRKTEEIKESYYHVKSIKYETSITPIIKQYVYKYLWKRIFGTANLLSKLQSGSMHLYIAYIFITVVVLIIFYL